MKYLIAVLLFFGPKMVVPPSIYEYKLDLNDGSNLKISDLKGKKILFLPISGPSPDFSYLSYLAQLQATNKNLVVVAVPAMEKEHGGKDVDLSQAGKSIGNGILISKPFYTNKSSGGSQKDLFQWLTRKELNGHFDVDNGLYDFMFVVSETGNLFAVLPKGVEESVLKAVIVQTGM
jgi:hypothetical protein